MNFRKQFTLVACTMVSSAWASPLELWYEKPADQWEAALPVGNGRAGAMVFGDTKSEHLQLNEVSMWAKSDDPLVAAKGNPEDLKALRELIDAGKVHEADKFIVQKFSRKEDVASHQTLGDLWLDWTDGEQPIADYRRALDLRDGVATVSYKRGEATITQTVIASYVDNAIFVHLKADKPKALNFNLRLNRPNDQGWETAATVANADQLIMRGQVTQRQGVIDNKPNPNMKGVNFEARVRAIAANGKPTVDSNTLQIRDTNEVLLVIAAGTDFGGEKDLEAVAKRAQLGNSHPSKSWANLLQRHTADHRKLMDRCQLELGDSERDKLPTDQRLAEFKNTPTDPGLEELLFQYGRYLLVGSSRGEHPANLQGLWNKHIKAPWNADYHLNINLQMNYWPAEVTNLSECHEPLFDLMKRMATNGAATAQQQYGMRGWMAHHATDLWGVTWMRADQPYWGAWIHGGGWLCQHLWSHYQYTQDKEFLKVTAWPLLSGQARFYLDWLVEKEGKLISSPETSPENSYIAADGKPAAVSAGAAMGQQIIHEELTNTLAAAEVLGIDDELVKEIREKLPKVEPGLNVGPDGRLLEWNKPVDEAEKGHRHMSHFYAFHPGNAISWEKTPELVQAVRKSHDFRMENGGAKTGWSRAWAINFAARFRDGALAHDHVTKLLQKSTYPNLFDAHPPFQIDGNFGATAGIAEMLMQSHEGYIHLLPALPTDWPKGSIKGLRARGGYSVDLEWAEGKVTKYEIRRISKQAAATVKVRIGEEVTDVKVK